MSNNQNSRLNLCDNDSEIKNILPEIEKGNENEYNKISSKEIKELVQIINEYYLKIDQLKKTINDMEKENKKLNSEINIYIKKIEKLKGEKNSSEFDYQQLKQSYYELLSENQKFKEENELLKATDDNSRKKYELITENNNLLKKEKESCNNKYFTLIQKLNQNFNNLKDYINEKYNINNIFTNKNILSPSLNLSFINGEDSHFCELKIGLVIESILRKMEELFNKVKEDIKLKDIRTNNYESLNIDNKKLLENNKKLLEDNIILIKELAKLHTLKESQRAIINGKRK